jgi:hypothetical protein
VPAARPAAQVGEGREAAGRRGRARPSPDARVGRERAAAAALDAATPSIIYSGLQGADTAVQGVQARVRVRQQAPQRAHLPTQSSHPGGDVFGSGQDRTGEGVTGR